MVIAKFTYIRSKPLMALYRTIPCQYCGIDDGTVCGAHGNSHEMGKGRGIKASDEFCASLCHKCHFEIDQGNTYTRTEKELIWNLAHAKTARLLKQRYGESYLKLVSK